MASEITTIAKDGSLRLPKTARSAWKGAPVSVRSSSKTIIIERVQESKPSFKEMLDEIRKSVKKSPITRKDIGDAVRWARAQHKTR